ncbi:MAG: redox-regulated ATPase YchF, partial [Anaerolineae bacterium]
MKLGIIGLPQAGKTTIFNALTGGDVPVTMSGGRFEVHTAVVDVPDPRVDALSRLYNPKKTTYAKVTYADIAGLEGSGSGDISGPLLTELSQMAGFLHVVRCFEDPSVPHITGSINPQRDIQAMEDEFILNDLIQVERRLKRLEEERQRGGRDKGEIAAEQTLFERLHAALEANQPLRLLDFTPEEEKALSGFGFLSRKPLLIVLNLGEGQPAPQVALPPKAELVALHG